MNHDENVKLHSFLLSLQMFVVFSLEGCAGVIQGSFVSIELA